MHPTYQSLITNRAAVAVAGARALQSINHNGLKGQLRELVVRELLEPLLPPGCVIGTGEIVSAYGGTSNQMDIVVADRRVLPSVLIRNAGIFPIEACLLSVEVKSRLTLAELRTSQASAAKVARFHHAPAFGAIPKTACDDHAADEAQTAETAEREIEHVIPFLLAFATDLTPDGKTEIERYAELIGSGPPAIRALCVIGRGYWVWTNEGWREQTLAIDNGEVVGLMADIINAAQRVAATRLQPDVREYLAWSHDVSDA